MAVKLGFRADATWGMVWLPRVGREGGALGVWVGKLTNAGSEPGVVKKLFGRGWRDLGHLDRRKEGIVWFGVMDQPRACELPC